LDVGKERLRAVHLSYGPALTMTGLRIQNTGYSFEVFVED
jgi:hypothetical protein